MFCRKKLCWSIVLIKLHALRKNLHFSSGHPNYTKRFAAFSKTLGISTWCSNKSDFERNKGKTRSWFVMRKYPEKLINSDIRKVKFNIREASSKDKNKNGVPFVVTYHPLINSLCDIIWRNIFLIWVKWLK